MVFSMYDINYLRVFNIYDAFTKMDNMMAMDDTNQQMDYILYNCKNALLSLGAEIIGKEDTKLRICYPAFITESID